MSSNHKQDEAPEQCSAKPENWHIDDKLKELSCPFTWGMENVVENRNKLLDEDKKRFKKVFDVLDDFPEFVVIYHLVLAHEKVISHDPTSATKSINEAGESLADIKKKGTLKNVETVLEHIFVATKCHVFQKLGQATELDELLDGICHIDDMNEVQSAMLSGCQCLAWSLYYATDNLMAIKSAEEAIEHDANNGKWHFLLGKNHRRLRRRHNSVGQKPSLEEILAFSEAFRLSKSVTFGLFLAQTYRECLKYDLANKIYKEIYDLHPTCWKVQLQLALGFIRAKQRKLAKSCLDYSAEHTPDSGIYEYHMGIYEEKCNNDFQTALSYYKTATEKKNFVAEWSYVECRKQVEPDWDPLPYLIDLLIKYDKDSEDIIQEINIKIGTYYIFENHDILSACITLSKTIEKSPNSKLLKQNDVLFHGVRVNVYQVLAKEIQFVLENLTAIHDDETIVILKNTLILCRKNCKNLRTASASSSHSQSRNSSRTRDQYSVSQKTINEERMRFGISNSFRNISRRENSIKHNQPLNMFRDNRESTSVDRRGILKTKSSKPLDKDRKDLASSSSSSSTQIPSLFANLPPRENRIDNRLPNTIRKRTESASIDHAGDRYRTIQNSRSPKSRDKDCKHTVQIPSLMENFLPRGSSFKQHSLNVVRDETDSALTQAPVRDKGRRFRESVSSNFLNEPLKPPKRSSVFCSRQPPSTELSSRYRNKIQGTLSSAKIRVEEERSNSSSRRTPRNQARRKNGEMQNAPIRFLTSRERDNKPRESPRQTTRGNYDGNNLSSTFKHGRDSASRHRGRGNNNNNIRRNEFSYPRDKNDESGASASCCLVKTLKNINL